MLRDTINNARKEVKRHLYVYWLYFQQYWKSRLVYKADFLLGVTAQAISLTTSLAFLGLLFTQVDNINGWTLNEMLFLAGVGGFIMNFHHLFLFEVYRLGDRFVVQGELDRVLVRPLKPLFQVYASGVSDNNLSKLFINAGIILYTAPRLSVPLITLDNIVYAFFAGISGVLVFAAIYLVFSSTAFWTGRSDAALWFIFQITDFRRYPYSIYNTPIKVLLVTLIPLAFASFFPATYFLDKQGWAVWQYLTLVAGPLFYLIAYRFWRFGLGNYSSTGS